jgi:putative transposase
MINYTYEFRLYPDDAQKVKLAQHFGCCRWVYNTFLDKRVQYYLTSKEKKLAKKSLNYVDTAKQLTKLKKEYDWLRSTNAQSLQHSLKNLDGAFNSFYKKLKGFPRFKSRRDKQSFRIPQHVKVKDGKLHIVKFKEGIKVRLHRPIEGEICNATISKNRAGQYFVCIGVMWDCPKQLPKTNKVVGIDLGLKDLATCSDGTIYRNIKPYRNLEKHRKILAQAHSRCELKSKGKEKARLRLAKLDNKIANIRNNHLHQISNRIVRENQTIILEDLNVKGMMKNHRLAKSIADVSFFELVRQITYKANWYGRKVIKIGRFFPSSKTCFYCGYINDSLSLNDRKWTCPRCSKVLDRDLNAARNIHRQGLNTMNQTAGIAELAECLGVKLT